MPVGRDKVDDICSPAAEEILKSLDQAGADLPLTEWAELLEDVLRGVQFRHDAALDDLRKP